MVLRFISRKEYRSLRDAGWRPEPEQLERWGVARPQLLAEGGAGPHALKGCGEIWEEISKQLQPAHLLLASGTGTTAAGILSAMPEGSPTKVHVISAVKGARREQAMVEALAIHRRLQVHWEDESAFGGFGRVTAELLVLRERFEAESGISIDPCYNAKVWAYLQRTPLSGSVVWLHTGGVFQEST